MVTEQQLIKAKRFFDLHQGKQLLLPNIWDPLGAALVENMGFEAVATASAAVAWSHGYKDAEKIQFDLVLDTIRSIVQATQLPVTADVESGYAGTLAELRENTKRLIDTGLVGINIEDFNHGQKTMYSMEEQSERLEMVKQTAEQMGLNLFINARIDIYTKTNDTADKKMQRILERGQAYLRAGAHCLFPIGVKSSEELQTMAEEWRCPVNVLFFPGVPHLAELKRIGVTRVSFGPNLLKISVQSIKHFLQLLAEGKGLDLIENNEVTSEFITGLLPQ